eukprot:gene811-2545_t
MARDIYMQNYEKDYDALKTLVTVHKVTDADVMRTPRPGQIVEVDYVGKLPNGQVFDSTKDRGRPFKFRLWSGEVIKGPELAAQTRSVQCGYGMSAPWFGLALAGSLRLSGWDLGLTQMSEGEKCKIVMSPSVAYGDKGFLGLYAPILVKPEHRRCTPRR